MSHQHTIIFLRLPKTASTTLQHIIRQQYRPGEIYSTISQQITAQESVARLSALPPAEKAKIRLLEGHFGVGIHKTLPQPTTYFTFLRHPIKRALSFYYFLRRTEHGYFDTSLSKPPPGLTEFLQTKSAIMMDNGQTRLLSGVWDTVPYGECTAAILAQAKRNLDLHFPVIGITERFDESLLLLKRAFAWKNVHYTRQNVTRNRPTINDIPAETVKQVAEHNQLDMALYAHAQKRFADLVRQQGADFKQDVARFRRLNQILNHPLSLYWQLRRVSVRAFLWRLRRDQRE